MIPPAKTGIDSNKRIAVMRIDQTNRGIDSIFWDLKRILRIVVIKLIAPRIEDAPATWREKMAKSTELLGCPKNLLRGG